jgi:hypothetical protein
MSNAEFSLIIHNSLLLQLLEKSTDIVANLVGACFRKLALQFTDDVAEGALAIALFQHLPPRSLQLDRTLREQNDATIVSAAPAATGRQARLAGIGGRSHSQAPASPLSGAPMRNAPGGGHPGCT